MARVLVVEDEAFVATDVADLLRSLGHEVTAIAGTGPDAITLSRSTAPDLVLMDVRLRGDMDGTEAARAIRASQDVPIVFMTAHGDPDTVRRACASEPFGYLVKPYTEHDVFAAVDVALFKHRAERLRRSQHAWFSATLRSLGDAVVATDPGGRVKFANAVAERLTGWREEEAVGRDVEEVMPLVDAAHRRPIESPARRALRDGKAVGLVVPALLVDRYAREVPVEDSAAPILVDGTMEGAVVVFRDVTEQKRLEAELALSSRLASLGTLTAGIAHEINTPLACDISSQAFASEELEEIRALLLLRQEPTADERTAMVARLHEVSRALDEARSGAERVRRIVAGLRGFAHPSERRGPVGLAKVVRTAIELAGPGLRGQGVDVAVDVPDGLNVLGDELQLGQVVLNLLLNAADSMAESPAARAISVSLEVEGGSPVLAIADSGSGISPEHIDRIFDPFFTTKPPGQGIGLGLAICHRIVEAHGGRIQVESRPGRGSTFRVRLPPSDG